MSIDSANFNLNPALGTSFKLEIPGFETLNYFVQTTSIPSVSMNGIESPYRNNQGSLPSNRIDYEPCSFKFIVDEDFDNYDSIRQWMHKIEKNNRPLIEELKDITLFLTNSNKVIKKKIVYYGSYPTYLTEVSLESSVSDVSPLVCTGIFRYQYFEILTA
jgi:hypothetical protein